MIHHHLILAAAANPVARIADQFGVQWPYLFAQIVSFAVVAFLLYKLAFKPVIATIDERQKKIEDGLRYAEEMKVKLAESERQQTETLKQAQLQAQQVIDEARRSAKDYYEKQTQEAAAKVELMMKKSAEATELERKKMLAEVRQEISRLVVLTSSRVLSRELTPQERSRYSETAGKELANV
jgi:F-type H+-transporting ATPase subunit b